MSKSFVFNRFDVISVETMPSAEGEYVMAQDAIDRSMSLEARIRVLELQLKEARALRRPHLVLAGSLRSAEFYAQRAGWSKLETRFVDSEMQLQGQRGAVLWVHASARLRKDVSRILEMARAYDMCMLPADDFLP